MEMFVDFSNAFMQRIYAFNNEVSRNAVRLSAGFAKPTEYRIPDVCRHSALCVVRANVNVIADPMLVMALGVLIPSAINIKLTAPNKAAVVKS